MVILLKIYRAIMTVAIIMLCICMIYAGVQYNCMPLSIAICAIIITPLFD